MHYDRVRQALYPDTADTEDFSYERVRRLLHFVRGEPATDFSGVQGFEVFSDRVQPHAQGWATGCGTAGRVCAPPDGPARTG